MTIKLADVSLDPPVFLAPLAGITDLPFRNLVQGFGAGLVVSEMVASQEMVQAHAPTRARAELGLGVANTAVQIAGRQAHWMAQAACMLQAQGARIIDINMGCPAKKVTGGQSGSALMRDPDHALRLIEAVVRAVDVPVTLKMRLGWDDSRLNAPEIARGAEAAGVGMITVHGRTRCQFYKGHADWRRVRQVVDAVRIPVIVNGDIVDVASARRALEQSGAAGVMIGRAARGAPWRLAEVASALFGAPAPDIPAGAALIAVIRRHYDAMLSFYGPELGVRVARKHLGWYMDGIGTDPAIRHAVLTESRPAHVRRLIGRLNVTARRAA